MDDVGQPQGGDGERESKAPLIVGVGASAGALDSIERFFSRLRLNPDQAVVLVLQDHDVIEYARLRDALQRSEGARVSEITDGQVVEGGVIHLCPSDMITTIQSGRFAVRRAEQARGDRATIDSFLVSLAEDRAEQSIGVVLAGTGGDGTLGVGTLKDHGGLAIAERIGDGQSNPHDEGSSAAAIADFVLPPEDIPERIDVYSRHLRRLETGTRLPPEFPITTAAGRVAIDIPPIRSVGPDVGLERRAQRIAERYAPAYVITDGHYHILHFSGRTGRYVEPTAGTATLDLLQLVHRDLRLELRTVLSRAAETNEPAHAEQVRLGVNGHRVLVDITVEPIQDGPAGHRNFVVLFKDGPIRPVEQAESNPSILIGTEHVERLESELLATRERLQATIEELENTNEKLKSSNEEYQSLNEELETSREELQSVNGELTTVNGELAHRVQELTQATSDLKNFLESTRIATVFLDNDLKVMNFTPAITHLLHLVETDVGRPIAHIKARIPIEELYDDVRRVQRTLASAERELTAPDSGTRYIVRILPYRSIDNFIAGVVISFIDVTAITRAEERQRLLLAELQHRVRNTLGVVRSIARRSAETSANVEDYASHLDGRLNAFARTQSLVTRDPEGGVDLEYLVVEELLAYNAREGEQLRVSGPGIRLQPKAAETFALAIHELATNALKYGALSQRAGRIDVTWRIDDAAEPRQLVFNWRERSGPEVTPPRRRGFGSDLLERTLAFEFKGKGTLEFNPSGLHCTIAIPMSPQAIHTPSMGS
ncbi:two-component sensor histidine kinase [Bradyrhizobium japonicum]|jgi:two-component system, chemotaxis family, CheB/CheR fusion protein|uniref:histidine kinase n=1 Tax=Bradyrhizobium elkanii TaxID=29448 RepID=A0ABV4F2C6_BRAEL|nr:MULTISPECIES: chemotaxis protein CheB [Bradyrhizobium]MBP2426588.1 two-component system CheB/CheR fusion protein [Bradyrhizobium elkanii]MCP1731184.1 two-component system CheB/CheR fusion protein [Bradyrhizobium elkanii]MCP1758167.1 two-component system CheB/CheR fusion protein [Bradyrhizobium elkanii]MCP1931740.1 two-component system CheB/CheR fusion protein [Bradyrhizobium elkanii]MCP1969733.1 two-component system CheB/CheR fusion protein [Bradyrhizobium elkanii]